MEFDFPNKLTVRVRRLEAGDAKPLFDYLCGLSPDSRGRFGPHAFDQETINHICHHPDPSIQRYVGWLNDESRIVAYMLFKSGFNEGEYQRFIDRRQFYDEETTVTFAPSVADDWQGAGLASAMYRSIENILRSQGARQIVLWGGVQATNTRARDFYRRHGFQFKGSFWYDGKDNIDMVKIL
jgi:ribosomal protein S18 acetylase RimI-like enzyme